MCKWSHSSVRHGTVSCGLLVLPQDDLLALTPSTWVARKCPSAGSLGKRHCPSMVAKMAVRVYVYMSVCLCVLLMSHTVYT